MCSASRPLASLPPLWPTAAAADGPQLPCWLQQTSWRRRMQDSPGSGTSLAGRGHVAAGSPAGQGAALSCTPAALQPAPAVGPTASFLTSGETSYCPLRQEPPPHRQTDVVTLCQPPDRSDHMPWNFQASPMSCHTAHEPSKHPGDSGPRRPSHLPAGLHRKCHTWDSTWFSHMTAPTVPPQPSLTSKRTFWARPVLGSRHQRPQLPPPCPRPQPAGATAAKCPSALSPACRASSSRGPLHPKAGAMAPAASGARTGAGTGHCCWALRLTEADPRPDLSG